MSWSHGDPITYTRLTAPVETVRMASLPQSYLSWIRSHSKDDSFLHQCVNAGVPLRTGTALVTSVVDILRVPADTPPGECESSVDTYVLRIASNVSFHTITVRVQTYLGGDGMRRKLRKCGQAVVTFRSCHLKVRNDNCTHYSWHSHWLIVGSTILS